MFWSVSFLSEENLSKDDELMERSLKRKVCYQDLLKPEWCSRDLP